MFDAGAEGGFQFCLVELLGLIEGDVGTNGQSGDEVATGAELKMWRC